MAITKSAKKALRQSIKRREKNIIYKDKMKKLVKELRFLIASKKIDDAKKLLPQVYQILDKSAKVGVIKKNAADRKKSRLTIFLEKSSK